MTVKETEQFILFGPFRQQSDTPKKCCASCAQEMIKKSLPFASVRLISPLAISFSLCSYWRLLSTMKWPNDTVEILILEHRERRCSWNSTSSFYVLHSKTNDASEEICQVLGFKASEVKEKFDSLLSSFRREQQNKRWKKYKASTEETCKSTRFAFKSMLFLMVRFKQRILSDSGEVSSNITC